jgi:hypothetical protein
MGVAVSGVSFDRIPLPLPRTLPLSIALGSPKFSVHHRYLLGQIPVSLKERIHYSTTLTYADRIVNNYFGAPNGTRTRLHP